MLAKILKPFACEMEAEPRKIAADKVKSIHLPDVATSEQPLSGNSLHLCFHKQKLKI